MKKSFFVVFSCEEVHDLQTSERARRHLGNESQFLQTMTRFLFDLSKCTLQSSLLFDQSTTNLERPSGSADRVATISRLPEQNHRLFSKVV